MLQLVSRWWRARPAARAGGPQTPGLVPVAVLAQRLWWAWVGACGVLAFGASWLQARGQWQRLVDADPSRISLVILVLTIAVTLWCGRRAWAIRVGAAAGSAWRRAHADDRQRRAEVATALLTERSHGPHETAWWFVAACIKLGLLGTVVGFIMMAGTIGRLPSFDIGQVQELLRQMTTGMAVALLTTLVGIVAHLWLGLQMLLLDRLADRVAADILSETHPPGTGHGPAA